MQFWTCISLYFREGNGTPLQYSCLENPMNGGALWAAVHGVAESRTRLSNFTFTFHFPALEKEMATHSSVLAWRIPGMGEPARLPSMGSHRVRHDWSDLAAAAVPSIVPWVHLWKRAKDLNRRLSKKVKEQVYENKLNTISHSVHACVWAQLLQLCPPLCNPKDCSLPGSSVHGDLQARILEWAAMPSSKGKFFTIWTTREAQSVSSIVLSCPTLCYPMASLSITNSWSSLRLMSIESVMLSNHLILACPLLLLPSVFPRIRVFSNESALHIRWPKYWSISFSISSSNEYSGLISFRIDCFDLLAVQRTLECLLQHHNSKAWILQLSAFFMVSHIHTWLLEKP